MEKRTKFTGYDILSDRSFTAVTKDSVQIKNDFRFPLFPTCYRDTTRWDNSWIKHVNYYQIALELTLEGSIEYSENGRKTITSPGTLFVIVPHSNVKIVNANGNQTRRKLELLICGNAPGCITQMLGFIHDTAIKLSENSNVEAKMRSIGKKMLEENTPHTELSAEVYQLLITLAEIKRSQSEVSTPEDVLKMQSFIHENFASKISVRDIADFAGMSEATIRRRFAEYLDISPVEYLNSIRLERAAAMLRSSDMPIKEVGFSCGFNSALYFTESFRKSFNCTPSAYRKQKG